MRILQVSDFFPDYGARIVDTVARRLASWGHDVLVVAGSVNQFGGHYSRGWTTINQNLSVFRFAALGIRGGGVSFCIPTPNLPSLLRIIRTFDPDVANLHFAPHLGNVLLAPFLRMEDVPILFTVHGVPKGYSSVALQKSSALINGLALLPIRLATRVIAVSEGVLRLAEQTYRIDPQKACVIPNGIDSQIFRPASGVLTRGSVCIGFCGRLSSSKNVESVIHALRVVREKYGLQATGLIAGDGPARKRLESLALELSVPVKFLGHLSQDDVVHFYHEIDYLAHPSTVEGLPQSVLEAMSCEVPVLACSVGGIKDLIVDKFNGILLRSSASDELAAAIAMVSQDASLKERIAANARLTILRSYSDSIMCSRYLEAYKDVCAPNSTAQRKPKNGGW